MAPAGSYVGGPSEVTTSTNFVQNAYDRMAYFALRPELYFDQVADVRATNQAMPGKTVIFTIVNDLAVQAQALSNGETGDVSPVAFTDSQVSVSLAEYGNAVVTSAKLRGTAYIDVDPVVANVIGYNAGVSLDSIARNVLQAGTQVAFSNNGVALSTLTATSRAGLTQVAGNQINSVDIRTARARLRAQNVPTFGGAYVGMIHPDVVVDLQSNDATLAGWRAPHTYSAPSEIWTGDLGMYEGVRWIETPRAPEFEGGNDPGGAYPANATVTTDGAGADSLSSTVSCTVTLSATVPASWGTSGAFWTTISTVNYYCTYSGVAGAGLTGVLIAYGGASATLATGATLTLAGVYTVAANKVSGVSDYVDGTWTGVAPVLGATVVGATLTGGATFSNTITTYTVTGIIGNQFTMESTTAGGCTGAGNVVFAAAGVQTKTNVYGTLILGRQSLAKAHALADGNGPLPSIIPGPVTDLLRRFVPLGWYWLGGYSIFRQASVYRLESVSSLNDQNPSIDVN